MQTKTITVIGSGRWGTFLAWYAATYSKVSKVVLCDLPNSPNYLELVKTRKNKFLTIPKKIELTDDLKAAMGASDLVIVSVSAQHLRAFAKSAAPFAKGKTFLLAIKGLELKTGKMSVEIMKEEIKAPFDVAVLAGPGHVQDYVSGIPSCAVIDSAKSAVSKRIIALLNSTLIRFYQGQDIKGTQVGAALKNVIGIAAGILDGLGWQGLKGALMARACREVGRIIKATGGKFESAYGLAHLGDYEATLFSPHSHNRQFGEKFAQGEKLEEGKLAEGYYTVKAAYDIAKKHKVYAPIIDALYNALYKGKDIRKGIADLMSRDLKKEFE
ncbi:MAG: NAD(P)H-dependent glycerol-3-phosphate dehydrogenase [Alphaproteobacteria bacterium]|nr:NAD(P)H-dependent glycerol-3-phosphate dehydrogenase [Alphaproteobacteria bacterium]